MRIAVAVLSACIALFIATPAGASPPTHKPPRAKRCDDVHATIVGTSASETIHGTVRNDIIWAGAGSDLVLAGPGDDIICGGTGYDTLFGQGGVDWVFGGKGKDLVEGGSGGDTLSDGPGTDVVRGQGGSDLMYGAGMSADHLFGGGMNDVIYSRDRQHIRDRVNAGAGDDDFCIANHSDIVNYCEDTRRQG